MKNTCKMNFFRCLKVKSRLDFLIQISNCDFSDLILRWSTFSEMHIIINQKYLLLFRSGR